MRSDSNDNNLQKLTAALRGNRPGTQLMTAYHKREQCCAICQHTHTYPIPVGGPVFGSYDLDTRPPGMMRELLDGEVFCCPSCGYSAPDLSQAGAVEQAIVAGTLYTIQLNHPDYPGLANRLLCWDLLCQANREWLKAAWACIHAAWACDDLDQTGVARQCRLWALNRIDKAESEGMQVAEPDVSLLLRLDLMRRSRRFKEAERLLANAPQQVRDTQLREVLQFQSSLVASEDDGCYTMDDLEGWLRTAQAS